MADLSWLCWLRAHVDTNQHANEHGAGNENIMSLCRFLFPSQSKKKMRLRQQTQTVGDCLKS